MEIFMFKNALSALTKAVRLNNGEFVPQTLQQYYLNIKWKLVIPVVISVGLTSVRSHAILAGGPGGTNGDTREAAKLVYPTLSTFSLPTLLIMDQNVDLSTSEAQARLIAEALGEEDSRILISRISEALALTAEKVAEAILILNDNGSELSLENIKAVITK